MACSIPVFRYALENWRPDPYVAWVLHRDDLTADQQTLIDTMQAKQFAGNSAANLVVKTVRVDAPEDEFASQLAKDYADQPLPYVILRKPEQRAPSETVFSAALTADVVSQVMESPLRTEIKDRLIQGDSVVWVYLECGIIEVDDEKFAMLTEELTRLQDEIELPEIEEEDLDELSTDPESLQIQFSAVRLSRDDASESVFRDMLLNVEQDLQDADYVNEPMAFPVFGRGRALYALVGDGLAPDLVEEACRFLTGACQCTVKEQNPGVDLMMQVEWDRFVTPTEAVDASLPPLAGFTGFGAESDETADAVAVAENEETTTAEPPETSETDEPSAEALQQQDDVDTSTVATDASSAGDSSSSAPVAVWQNAMYVLLLAGVAVVLATMLLMRRAGS